MIDPIDIETRARLVNAGWQPPQPDYEKWRRALAAYYLADGCPSLAKAALDSDRPLEKRDREVIRLIAAASVYVPGPQLKLVPADTPDADRGAEPGSILRI